MGGRLQPRGFASPRGREAAHGPWKQGCAGRLVDTAPFFLLWEAVNLSYECCVSQGVVLREQDLCSYHWRFQKVEILNFLALEPWNQSAHLDKQKRVPGLLLRSQGPNQAASRSPVCSEAAKIHARCCPQRPWIATDLSPTHPWPVAPQLIGRSTRLSVVVPAALPTRAGPRPGGPPSGAPVSARVWGGGAGKVFLPRHCLSPR